MGHKVVLVVAGGGKCVRWVSTESECKTGTRESYYSAFDWYKGLFIKEVSYFNPFTSYSGPRYKFAQVVFFLLIGAKSADSNEL